MYHIAVFRLQGINKEEIGTNYCSLRKLLKKGQWVMKVMIWTVLYSKADK